MSSWIAEKTTCITAVKDIVNITFFILTGILAFYSYLNAKKTLFSPIRTEIFKLQIKEFEIIINKFRNMNEIKIIQKFDEENIFKINYCKIIEYYANKVFNKEIKFNNLEHIEISGSLVSAATSQKYIQKIDLVSSASENVDSQKIDEQWEEIDFGVLDFTKKYTKMENDIKKLATSPILPENISQKILKINRIQYKNLQTMIKIFDKFSKNLPTLAPSFNDIGMINLSGLYNEYNCDRIEISGVIDDINIEIKNYLKIEKLIN